MSSDSEHYTLHVNGIRCEVTDSWLGESLLDVLRDRLGLLGTKGACTQGECGSCSVLVDGALVCSCLVMAASAVRQTIVTIEGIAPAGAPSDVQAAFVEAGEPWILPMNHVVVTGRVAFLTAPGTKLGAAMMAEPVGYEVDQYDLERDILQIVGRRTDVALDEEWNGRAPRTQIVAIGAPGSIDAESLGTQFEACISRN